MALELEKERSSENLIIKELWSGPNNDGEITIFPEGVIAQIIPDEKSFLGWKKVKVTINENLILTGWIPFSI